MAKKRRKLTERQRRAVKLYSYKPEFSLSNKEIAEIVGVSERTLYNWLADIRFNKELSKLSETIMKSFTAVEAYQTLNKIISSPLSKDSDKIRAIKLALTQQRKLSDKQEHTVKVDEVDVESIINKIKEKH